MGYFSNGTEGMIYEDTYCLKCVHWPKDDDASGCPVLMAHHLYAYEMCNQAENPAKVILDMLIPPTKGLGNDRCAMFSRKDGLTAKHLKDWEKYKAVMAEAESAKGPA